MSHSAEIDVARANAALTGTRFAGRLHHFFSIDSTNAALLTAAHTGAAEGTVYIADEQTAGRGRGGHSWLSVAGEGLYMSVLAAPPLPLDRALWLSLATGLAVQAAVVSTSDLRCDIRWPNDLLIGEHKCGGILVETAVGGETLRHAVIGIGINLNQTSFPPELAPIATSLRLACGSTPVHRETVVVAILRALDFELTRLESGDDTLLARFAAASSWVTGKRVRVEEAGGYTGVTTGLNAAGFLQVRESSGAMRTVISGGVRAADAATI